MVSETNGTFFIGGDKASNWKNRTLRLDKKMVLNSISKEMAHG